MKLLHLLFLAFFSIANVSTSTVNADGWIGEEVFLNCGVIIATGVEMGPNGPMAYVDTARDRWWIADSFNYPVHNWGNFSDLNWEIGDRIEVTIWSPPVAMAPNIEK